MGGAYSDIFVTSWHYVLVLNNFPRKKGYNYSFLSLPVFLPRKHPTSHSPIHLYIFLLYKFFLCPFSSNFTNSFFSSRVIKLGEKKIASHFSFWEAQLNKMIITPTLRNKAIPTLQSLENPQEKGCRGRTWKRERKIRTKEMEQEIIIWIREMITEDPIFQF